MKYIGAHINKNKTLLNTIEVITKCGGNALQLFASNPRSAKSANIENFKKEAPEILDYCKKNNFKLVIHSPYTINLAKELKEGSRILDIDDCYWVNLLINELIIADIIGAVGTVVHVGKYTKITPEEGLNNMKKYISYILMKVKELNLKSQLILETATGQGTELLVNLNDYLKFYNSFTKDEKKNFKLCIDTCHIWSAGYEISDAFKLLIENNSKDIAIIHFNNSETIKGAKVDRHAPIFEGKIPLDNLKDLLSNLKINPIIILEKPTDNIDVEFDWIKKYY